MTRAVVGDALATLDEDDRALILLRFWLDLDYADAAEHLGRSVSALSRRFRHHVAPLLRERLADLAAA